MTERRDKIRQKILNNEFFFSSHALRRMGERKILKHFVLDAILNGKELERQEFADFPDAHFLFQDNVQNPDFCVVVAEANPEVVIITVFYFDEYLWDFNGTDYTRRRTT